MLQPDEPGQELSAAFNHDVQMNRRSFFRNLVLGAAVLPVAALAKPPAPARVARHVADIPPEAGKVNCMALFKDHVFVGCDNGVWTIKTS